jgi:hypothetical protein
MRESLTDCVIQSTSEAGAVHINERGKPFSPKSIAAGLVVQAH